jgi:ADP-ribose pyrophosphatase YjhB (NUDIX family)
MFDRSAAVKLQLRDKKGRFIKMGDHVKWHSLESNSDVSGIARGVNGNNIIVEFSKGGKNYHIQVPHNKIEAIQEKAHLDAAYVEKMGGHTNTPNITDKGVTISPTITHYGVNSKDPAAKLTTPVSDLKPGDVVYPIKSHTDKTPSSIQKSPYNTKEPAASAHFQKHSASGHGVVQSVAVDKDTGLPKYAVIKDENGKNHFPSASHHVVKQNDELDKAILNGHAQETEAFGHETPNKLVNSVKGTHTEEDHFHAADAAEGSKVQVASVDGTHITLTKTGDNQWKNESNGLVLDDKMADHMVHADAPEKAPDEHQYVDKKDADTPLGDNFKALPPMATYQKGDVAVLKDGTLGAWIGKGQLELEDGSKVSGNKFAVDGEPKVIAGKDIGGVYRPVKNVVHTPSDGPFGEGFHGYSFDLSKPNNENFKAGDFVVYGKEKNEGKIFSVNPTNILVEKLNSDKTVHGTATIVAGQVHGKYVKDKSAGPTAQEKIDNAGKMYGEGSKQHDKAKELFGKDAAESPKAAPEATPEAAPEPEAPAAADATKQSFPDKGKSIKDSTGADVKVNDMVHFAGKGVGKVMIVLPSTDSVRVMYPDGTEKVHKFNKITKVEGDAPKIDALPEDLKVGDSGVDPNTHTAFIVGLNNTLIHKGDTVTHQNGDKGTVAAIYKGEKTVKVTWDDGHTTGPKKASTLEGVAKHEPAPTAPSPDAVPEIKVEAPKATPYTPEDEKALVNFKDHFMEIGEHLRGSAEHAFADAGPIIHDLDALIAKSQLKEDLTTYRGFVTLDPKVIESLVPGTLMYEKSFTSTSLDPNIAADSLDLGPLVEAPKNHAPGMAPPEVEHSVIVKFNLPKGSYGHQINYDGLSDNEYKQDSHEKEVILPRAYNYEIKHVEDGTDAQGRPLKTVTVQAVAKSGAEDQGGPGMHAVEASAEIGSKPFKILEDPGADGDGFHPSGPWGHFGASGVMVEAPHPETGEPQYLIVENGDLHEEQNRGLWQLPGGAANGNENPYQAAAREMHEELEVDPTVISNFEHAGSVAFANGKGWAYTNIGAKAPTQFDMKLDGYETSGAKWVSADELRAMRDDGSLLPAFGHNVDNLLAVYKPKDGDKTAEPAPAESTPEAPTSAWGTSYEGADEAPAAEPEASSDTLDIGDFTAVGKYSDGSNDGQFYTDKSGQEYYIKYNMAEDHAMDEILASKIYLALGVNAANQQKIDMGNGKIGVASKIIKTDGHSSNIHLNDPEYRKEVQKDFAVDALLANWDVAGLGYNNLMTDTDGKPLRLDPGASLRFRAQGAPKSDFGPSANEWDYLRTGANSESSAIKPTASLFKEMTPDQLKESASKLNELTDDNIDSMVDSVGYDKKDGDFLKETLKARRDDILKRAGVTNTANETGAPHAAEEPAGNGTPNEAGPEEGGQVPLDSGTGTDPDAADTGADSGGVQHQVGDVVQGTQIPELPIGSKIQKQSGAKIGMTKISATQWLKDGNTTGPFEQDFISSHYHDKDWKVLALPSDSGDLKNTPLPELTTDTTIHLSTGNWFFKKGDDGVWHAINKHTQHESATKYSDKEMGDFLKALPNAQYDVQAPETAENAPAQPDWVGKSVADFGKDKLADLPTGTEMSKDDGLHYFKKLESGKWQAYHKSDNTEKPSGLATPEQVAGMPDSHAEGYKLSAPAAEDVSAADPAISQKALSDYSPSDIIAMPVGSKLLKKNGSYYEKLGHDQWQQKLPDGKPMFSFTNGDTSAFAALKNNPDKFSRVSEGKAPEGSTDVPGEEQLINPSYEDLQKLPDGTVITTKKIPNVTWTKKGNWLTEKDSAGNLDDYPLDALVDDNDTYTVVKPAEIAIDSDNLPATLEAPSESTLDALPDGTVLTDESMPGFAWTKDGDIWQAKSPNGTNTLPSSSLVDGATYNVNEHLAKEAPAAVDTTHKVGDLIKPDVVANLPIGTVFHASDSSTWKFKKVGDNELVFVTAPNGTKFKIDQMIESAKSNPDYRYQISELPASATPAPADAAGGVKVGDKVVGHDALHALPVGAEFSDDHGYGANYYVKDSPTTFKLKGTDTPNLISETPQNATVQITKMPGTTGPSGASVTGKDGQQIFKGDQIQWQTKGITGKVADVDMAAGKVQMVYADGSKKWYMANKMVKTGSASVAQPAPVKVNMADPSSPLYGTPAPEFVAPEPSPADHVSYAPEGFLDEIKQRYAAKVNPNWSKENIEESYHWQRIHDFINKGDKGALATLHEKKYISDEMFANAKDHVEKSEATITAAKIAKQQKDQAALKEYSDKLSAWEKANGISSQSAIVSTFPKMAAQEWSSSTGYVTNADGTQSANWSMAPKGSYAVSDIMTKLSDSNLAAHGISAMVDHTSIKDSNVRFNKVVMPDGTVKMQAKFEVHESARDDVINKLNAAPGGSKDSYVQMGFTEYSGNGDLSSFAFKNGAVDSLAGTLSGYTYQVDTGKSHITFQAESGSAGSGSHGTNAGALRSMAYITMPEDASPADLEQALKAMGIADAHPADAESVNHHKMKQILGFFDGFIGETDTKYEEDPDALQKRAALILAKQGAELDDFKLVMTENGFHQFRVPNAIRDRLTAESGVHALVHSNMDWVPAGDNDKYSYSLNGWNESDGLDRVMKKFTGGSKGYLPTAIRMNEGDNSKGMSPDADIISGGSRYLFMTPVIKKEGKETKSLEKQIAGNKAGIVAHGSLAFQYLGNVGNFADNGAGNRSEGSTIFNEISKIGNYNSWEKQYETAYEAMIYSGVSVNDSWFSITNAVQKPFLIKSLKEQGVTQINGLPIEEYFVIPGTDPIPEWKAPNDEPGN